MKTYIVVEGASDAILMRPLLEAAGILEAEIVEAGGKSSAASLGNSIALSRLSPVAVLVDADTTDKRMIKEQYTVFTDLQRYTPSDVNCRLFLAVPAIEEDLFPSAREFARVYNLKLSEQQQALFARDRKKVIQEFYSAPEKNAQTTIRHGPMDRKAARSGWGNRLLADLFQFLEAGKVSARAGPARQLQPGSTAA